MTTDERAAPQASPTETTVADGRTARIGSRVKHWGQRYTPYATATVTGFEVTSLGWVKVLVDHDSDKCAYAYQGWDWDRTEIAEDPDWAKPIGVAPNPERSA